MVFDNDAAGREAEQKVKQLDLPSNMTIVRLPHLADCTVFPTVGPTGDQSKTSTAKLCRPNCF